MATKDFINRITQGDCLELMKELDDKSIDLVVTDPPYGIGINKMNFVTSGAVKVGGAYRNDYTTHDTDWDSDGLTKDCFDLMRHKSNNQIIFGANNFSSILPESRCWIVWDKRIKDKYSNDFSDIEMAWTSFDRPSRIIRHLWSGMLQQDMKNKEKRVHPTQKPVQVIINIIKMFSNEGDTILDPFLGSGTTAVACKLTGRDFIGFELDGNYCNIARKRVGSTQGMKEGLVRWGKDGRMQWT